MGQNCEMAQVVFLCEISFSLIFGERIIQRYLQLTSMEDNEAGPTSNFQPVMVLVGFYLSTYSSVGVESASNQNRIYLNQRI